MSDNFVENQIKQGFAPLFCQQSKVLILGSFPSVVSRKTDFYYANKQNRFWGLMQEIFGGEISTVLQKQQLILQNGLALWDIVDSCHIQGSSDSDIKQWQAVDLKEVTDHCDLQEILCNGKKSYQLTKLVYNGNLPVIQLPSTSSANVRFDAELWKKHLQPYAQKK